MTETRPYGGVDAAERLARRRTRLLEAGLDLLGGEFDPAEITVRGICQRAGLATRYFYESFTDKDHLIGAVFDLVTAQLAATTQAAVAAAPLAAQNRAGLANIVRCVEADPRIGRLMFSPSLPHVAVLRKRQESDTFFAMLSGQHVESVLHRSADAAITAFSHFVVGGVRQTISAWLAGDVDLTSAQLIDQLAATVDAFATAGMFDSEMR